MLDPLDSLAHVRWPLVLFLTAFSLAFIAVWNSPLMYGGTWARVALPARRPKGRPLARLFLAAALLQLPLLVLLGAVVRRGDSLRGLAIGLLVGLGGVATTLGATYLLAGRPLVLYLIDAGYFVVFLALAGVVLAY